MCTMSHFKEALVNRWLGDVLTAKSIKVELESTYTNTCYDMTYLLHIDKANLIEQIVLY